MRKWCKSHPVLFMAFYAVFYLSCFAFWKSMCWYLIFGCIAVWIT